ncbi:MAG: hypothetical protein QOF74_6965 [Caballeronia mineralivorans]|jgi:hypothetical protein|nr:hypothetical protein [Caballeronia mineralivorans]
MINSHVWVFFCSSGPELEYDLLPDEKSFESRQLVLGLVVEWTVNAQDSGVGNQHSDPSDSIAICSVVADTATRSENARCFVLHHARLVGQ